MLDFTHAERNPRAGDGNRDVRDQFEVQRLIIEVHRVQESRKKVGHDQVMLYGMAETNENGQHEAYEGRGMHLARTENRKGPPLKLHKIRRR